MVERAIAFLFVGCGSAELKSYCNITVIRIYLGLGRIPRHTLGRTVPSFRMVIDSETTRISAFYGKKFENKKDKVALSKILSLSKRHSHACSEAVRFFPIESILMAILLERQKTIENLIRDKVMSERLIFPEISLEVFLAI